MEKNQKDLSNQPFFKQAADLEQEKITKKIYIQTYSLDSQLYNDIYALPSKKLAPKS